MVPEFGAQTSEAESLCLSRTTVDARSDTVRGVVTAKTQYSLSNAQTYFAEHLAVGDYYQEGQRVAGEWFGIGAAAVNLSGKVKEAEFQALCENRHPVGHGALTQRTNSYRQDSDSTQANRRIFFDFTFSPPKSVSIAALIGGDERIGESHERAVRIALTEFEVFAATRIRKGKADDYRLTGNVVAALFTHDTSRALDPHLHTHCIVFNATHDSAEQRWKALQNFEMLRARKYSEAVYYHELAKELRRFGYGIRNKARGDFEIEGVSEELCERFSKRHGQIDAAQAALLQRKPELVEINQQDLREHLATAERSRKQRDVGHAELRRHWTEQMSPTEQKAVADLIRQGSAQRGGENPRSAEDAIGWAEEHLFDRRAVVPQHEIWRQALIWARGEPLTVAAIKQVTDKRNYVRDKSQVPQVTTRQVLAREWEVVRAGLDGVSACGPLVNSSDPAPSEFTAEQGKALLGLLQSRDFITLFRGGAGTGKSFVLKTLVDRLCAAGHSTLTLAPQRQQVTELAANGFVAPTTLAEFLTRQSMPPAAVVVLDEAGQVGGAQMVQLVRLVREHGGRLILSGDTRQHGPVAASDAMFALERYAGLKATELRRIRRQNPTLGRDGVEKRAIRRYRRAVADAAAGRLEDSFAALNRMGAVIGCPVGDQGHRLAEEYIRIAAEGGSQVVVTQTWNEVNRTNDRVRAGLKAKGLLAKDDHEVEALEHVDLTDAQKRDARYYPTNATVVLNQPFGKLPRGAKGRFITSVERGVMVDVNRAWHLIPHKQLHRVTVCRPRRLPLAHGDRLQLKANRRLSSGARVANGELVTVECVHADGRIALQDGRTLDPDYREFLHGYAITSYGSQGKTVDYVLFSDSAVRAATNARQWYVTISRGRRGVRIFTPDKAALRENILRSGNSRLALDLTPPDFIKHPGVRRASALWQRWMRGWSKRVSALVARIRFTRAHKPNEAMRYGKQTS